MALGGRPKEEGGHKPLKISVDKFVAQGLEKVGNKSQFLESVARPILEKLDPGEASVFLWRIDIYLSQGIIKASQEGDFNKVQALGWLASQLEDARKLCGIPESNEELQRLRKENLSQGHPTQGDLAMWFYSTTLLEPYGSEVRRRIIDKYYPKEKDHKE